MSWRDPPRLPDDARCFIPFWAEQPADYDPWLSPMAQPATQRTAPPIGMLMPENGSLHISRDPAHMSHVTEPTPTELGAPRLRDPYWPEWLDEGAIGENFEIGYSPIGCQPQPFHPQIEDSDTYPDFTDASRPNGRPE